MSGKLMSKGKWLLLALASLTLIVVSGVANASYPATPASGKTQSSGLDARHAQDNDGFDQLPPGLRAVSMSSLVSSGRVHPQVVTPIGKAEPARNVSNAPVPINWGTPQCTSCGNNANSPAASMHPSDPAYALVSGNISVDSTANGGFTWNSLVGPPWFSGDGHVVNAWLPASPNQDSALLASLSSCSPCTIAAGRTTDRGATWTPFVSNINNTGFSNDRPYFWADQEPSSPFYGRVYMTYSLFDSGITGSYNGIGIRYTSDGGNTWNPPSPGIVQKSGAINAVNGDLQWGSLGFQNDGAIVEGWMEDICCGSFPDRGSFNKYYWARSTDGGVTFPISGTLAQDTRAESISFNATSPAGFRWSPQLTVAGDPVDGTLYAVWLKFRTPGMPQGSGAAVAIARSTDNGVHWSTPTFVYNNPDPAVTQYMPWVAVSRDHTVHVSFTSSQSGSSTTLSHYYMQSNDRGFTWSAPFQLSLSPYTAAGYMGDDQAMHIGAYNGSNASIISSWTGNSGGTRHYASIGTFNIVVPPTPTPVPPTPTFPPTLTPTETPTLPPTNTPTTTPTPIPPDFSIAVNPSTNSLIRPGSATYTVTLASLNNFSGNVNLSVSGLPNKTIATFDPPAVSLASGGTGTSTLTITAEKGGPRGTFTLTITGTSGTITHTQDVTLVITTH